MIHFWNNMTSVTRGHKRFRLHWLGLVIGPLFFGTVKFIDAKEVS